MIFHAQNLKQSQNQDFGIDMAWSVLKSMIFFVDPYSVLASAFQHLPANIAVDSPKCETVAFFTTPSSLGGGLGGFGEALGRPLNSKNQFFWGGFLDFFAVFQKSQKKHRKY